MTEDEAYKVHIQYTFNAFCKVVIRHAAIDKILKLRRLKNISSPSVARPPFCTMRNLPLPLPFCRSRHRKKFSVIISCASRSA